MIRKGVRVKDKQQWQVNGATVYRLREHEKFGPLYEFSMQVCHDYEGGKTGEEAKAIAQQVCDALNQKDDMKAKIEGLIERWEEATRNTSELGMAIGINECITQLKQLLK